MGFSSISLISCKHLALVISNKPLVVQVKNVVGLGEEDFFVAGDEGLFFALLDEILLFLENFNGVDQFLNDDFFQVLLNEVGFDEQIDVLDDQILRVELEVL